MAASAAAAAALGVITLVSCAVSATGDNDPRNNDLHNNAAADIADELIMKQVVWKRCYRKITPSCLRLQLVRALEMMSSDIPLFPGISLSSNSSEPNLMPLELARSLSSEHAPLDDLVAYTLNKYLRSLTLNINLIDFVSGGNRTYQDSVVEAFSGRGTKNGLGQYGPIAAMMGGTMASLMMAALAALAGKALMTSLLALMMAAFAALKGGGGHGESKTYEVITKPVVSHVNTHSSEVQHDHGHYHHKRSLEEGNQLGFSTEQQEGNLERLLQRRSNEDYLAGGSQEEVNQVVFSARPQRVNDAERLQRTVHNRDILADDPEVFRRDTPKDSMSDETRPEHSHEIRKRSLDYLRHRGDKNIINSPSRNGRTFQRQHPRFRREVNEAIEDDKRESFELLKGNELDPDKRFKRGIEEYRVVIDTGTVGIPPHPINNDDSMEDRLTLHIGKNNLRHFRSVDQNDYKPSKIYFVNPKVKTRQTFLGKPRQNYRKYERSL